MAETTEQRIAALQRLMEKKRQSTLAHAQYLAENREYAPGERLYMREVHLIMAIGMGAPQTMSELAQKLNVTPGAVSQIAARLEKKGYLLRAPGRGDRRQSLASLTEKGAALYREHSKYDRVRYESICRCFAQYSDEQLRLFEQYEETMTEIFLAAQHGREPEPKQK